MLVMGVLLASN